MQAIKETAANIGASAKAGLEKTKAVVEEKVEKMTARDPVQKEKATEKKDEKIAHAELNKHEAREHNTAAKQTNAVAGGGAKYTSGGGNAAAGYGTTDIDTTSGDYGTLSGLETKNTRTAADETVYPVGGQKRMSAMPGHGIGQTFGGNVVDNVDRVVPDGRTRSGATDFVSDNIY